MPDLGHRTRFAIYLVVAFLGVAASALVGMRFVSTVPGVIILYLLPVLFATWFAGRTAGLMTIGASVLAWLWIGVDDLGGVVDGIVHFALFAVVVLSISAYRTYYLREKERALTDPLTGLLDRRGFLEYAKKEVARANRYQRPVSVAYIDVDNFKEINEQLGHAGGDTVLRTIAMSLQHSTRKIDVVARLGGDEFSILLPESGAEGAKSAISGLRSRVREDLKVFDRPVTLSIGAITFERPGSVEEMLKRADETMYKVKHGGKDAMLHWISRE
jgi:diguanylate cyclase (GGDEF)-like protein